MTCANSPVRQARAHWARLLTALLLAVTALSAGLGALPAAGPARADEVTISGNNLRDSWDSAETTAALTPATLTGGSFGELFSAEVDGQVYAQPIVAGSTLIVATENDRVYGLSTATGAVKWSTSLGTPWPSSADHCTDLQPNVGVTGTPVYDPASGAVYLVSEVVPPGHTAQQPVFYLNALDASTGQQEPNWPVQITGPPANDRAVPFAPLNQLQRPGLLLLDGSVYAGFGSHCDFQPYRGYVVGVSTTSRTQTMWSDESGVTDAQAGIWQSGGGLMSDGSGRIFFASGNGVSPAPGAGTRPPSELAESVVRLAVQKDGTLAARDFFSPANAPYLDSIDGDLGSGGPVGLPFGTAALPHLLVVAGKVDGLFVLDRDKLGGRSQGPGHGDAAVSEAGQGLPGQWGHQAAFADTPVLSTANAAKSHDYVYHVGRNDALRYFRASLGGAGGVTPELTDVAQSSDKFGYTSGSPVVTSNGTKPGTGVVWVVNSSDETGTTGRLQAFPAVPPGTCSTAKPCTLPPLWTSMPFSGAGKFTTAATDSGRVFVATRGVVSDGSNCPAVPAGDYCAQVIGFGSPSEAPLGGAAPVDFGYVPVGSASAAQTVTVANTQASANVTVTSVAAAGQGYAAAGPFQYTPSGGSPVTATLPATLHPGDTLAVQGITFTPGTPGGANGSLQFSTNSVNFPLVGVSLSGIGTQNGFYAPDTTVAFGPAPVGTTTQQQLTVTNGESVPETLSGSGPGGPFGVAGLPPGSQEIQPGQSVLLTLTYQPTATGADSGSLTLTGDDGTATTQTVISLSGSGVADIEPTLTGTASLDFGNVPLGQQVTKTITLVNTGNMPAVISASSALPLPFGTSAPVTPGLPVTPGSQYVVHVPVTFAPTSQGAASTSYQVSWTDADASGPHSLQVALTGTGVAPAKGIAVPPPGGGWRFNGSAAMSGTGLSLTQLTASQAGSAVYSVPMSASGLTATFKVRIGGGTGADGLTFALLDASQTDQTALGGVGGELGFGGLPGAAVTLDTFKDGSGYPSNSFVGIATGAQNGLLTFAGTANVPGLRSGTHVVGVSVSAGTIAVTVDGERVLSRAVTLPPSVRLAFTAANGSRTDNHVVSAVTITAGGHPVPAPGGGWSYNGAAATAGSDTQLTSATPNQAGSVVYAVPVKAIGLKVTFDAQLGGSGAIGGDGLTLALLNPATTTSSMIGSPGTMLGLGTSAGVPGIAAVLATDGPTSPAGFVALSAAVGTSGLRFQRAAHGIGSLTLGTNVVTVTVTKTAPVGVVMTVYLDGVQVLQQAEPTLTSTVRLAFTAGTAAATELHLVRDVSIAAAG